MFGVEPICTTLTSAGVPIAPSTFYAARTRPPSGRAVRDEELKPVIARVHQENYGVYGIRKMHAQLNREEVLAGCQPVARCTTARLMKDLGLRGISRTKSLRTTVPGTGPDTRPDLVERTFTAERPNRLWVADITYVRTFAGWVYCAARWSVCRGAQAVGRSSRGGPWGTTERDRAGQCPKARDGTMCLCAPQFCAGTLRPRIRRSAGWPRGRFFHPSSAPSWPARR
jgi:hypothetical protein